MARRTSSRTSRKRPRHRARTTTAVTTAVAVALGTAAGIGVATGGPSTSADAAASGTPVVSGTKVGAGSYATTPPASVDVADTVDQKLYIDSSQSGKPVPTNAWWTDLVVSKYSGDLWADPLVLSNSAAGTKVSYPTTWNSEGTAMQLGGALTVGGSVVPTASSSDRVLADFENGIPAGWTSTGTAFSATSAGTAKGQSTVTGYYGNGLLNSFTSATGDGATGTLTSPSFTVDKPNLSMLLGGGKHAGRTEVRLVVGGKTVQTATGTDSEKLSWVTWDVSQYAGQQAQIVVVDDLTAGWAHILLDEVVLTDDPAGLPGRLSTTFNPSSASALAWGDWNVSWRMTQTGGDQHVDVTAARGEPYTWFEFAGVTPTVTVLADATVTDAAGKALTFPFTADRFEIRQGGRTFGVHAPVGTTFTRVGNVITASAGTPHLVVSAVPTSGLTLDDLAAHAFAVPRDTTMEYTYDPVAGKVEQTWNVTTEALEGTNRDVVQGWLPHQYQDATTNLSFTGTTYQVPRGTMKTTIGHGGWTTTYDFEGITPIAAAPTETGEAGDYSTEQMKTYLAAYAAKTTYGGDTYWGGKDVLQLAQYMMAARQIGDTEDAQVLQDTLRGALTDWFTYSDGETQHFFARYPTWKALVGFGESYGSAEFTDNHFHYGYFVAAAALLASVDPTWKDDYGQMATLVAKQYANGDRTDTDYPYLRTFDAWEGHSYAGGFSSPGGNNQESSSEAIQSWAGLFLLGSVLGDTQMQATGAMGYVTERASVREYWLDYNGNPDSTQKTGSGTHPAAYDHGTTGILFDSGQAYATYFSGDPAWIYGIQWMPTAPWLSYLGWDPEFSRRLLQDMFDDRPRVLGQEGTVSGNEAHLQMLTKKWWGVGTYGTTQITQDRTAAIAELKDAVRAAELNHPGWVTARTASNPFYDQATNTLYVSTAADGSVVFPNEFWTPTTLPAALVPAQLTGAEADKAVTQWTTPSPLLKFLATGYQADTATTKALYSVDVEHYVPGRDTAQAAAVFSRMGDALGNVVLGFLGQFDPDVYADIHQQLLADGDPVATTGTSMAGMVYYQAMSNRSLGRAVTTRHTSNPLSQVFLDDATGRYSYVLYNPTTTQQTYDVYDGTTVIGRIAVPAGKQIVSHLDATLTTVQVTATDSPKTVTPGSATKFTATGFDQYGATIALPATTWAVSGGGTIGTDGTFSAATATSQVTVTATSGAVSGSYHLRVGAAPVLSSIAVSPAFARITQGSTGSFSAQGRDQYGDPFALPGAVTWNYSGSGSVDSSGRLSASGTGAGYVTATVDGLEGSAVASVVAAPADLARGAVVTATSTTGTNTAAKAVDGNAGTRWESVTGVDAVDYTVDLGRRADLSQVQVVWEAAAAASYDLQVADDPAGPWTTVQRVTKANAAADTLPVDVSARYVRVHGVSRLTQYGYSIYELHVLGTPNVSTITPSAVLVGPRTTALAAGSSAKLTAYAFDTAGNGGATGATWSVTGGGSVSSDGTFTAPATGATSTVTAAFAGLSGTASVRTQAPAATPTATPTATATATAKPTATATAKPTATASPTTTAGSTASAGNGGDLAYRAVVTSSADEGPFTAAKAVDGDPGTRWSSGFSDAQWIQADLGSVQALGAVNLRWEQAYAKRFVVQVRSDASAPWTTVVTEDHGTGGNQRYALTGVSARYVRMLGVQRATQYGYSLYEFGVEPAAMTNLAFGKPATASSSEAAAFAPAKAVDASATSRWSSGRSDREWWQVDLGATRTLHSATLHWESAYARSYQVLGRRTEGDSWTVLATVTNGDGGVDTLALSGDYRFVRVQGVQRATQYGYSLYDVQIS